MSLSIASDTAAIDQGIYAINRIAFEQLSDKLFTPGTALHKTLLLLVVNTLVTLDGSSPQLDKGKDAQQRKDVRQILEQYDITGRDDIYDSVVRYFSQLFDFELKMPHLEPLMIKGEIRVVLRHTSTGSSRDRSATNGGAPPPTADSGNTDSRPLEVGDESNSLTNTPAGSEKDIQNESTTVNWGLYYLFLEYNAREPNDPENPKLHVRHCRWSSPTPRNANRINFDFTENYPLIHVSKQVTIKVKAFNGEILYYKEFHPLDPALRDLKIEVKNLETLQIEGPQVPASPSGSQGNKPLRGKIVSLSKHCSLQGVVVIQIHKGNAQTGDSWITVSSGFSDKEGNFTIRYPLGNCTNARALTSLSKSITPIDCNNGHLSSDFIYILLLDDDVPDTAKKKDDCHCSTGTAVGRLPSQDDLIESDQFTQDLGGTCVNLSVPNRTLNEYSYQAVVRHTDPDILTYSMRTEDIKSEDGFSQTKYYLELKGKIVRRPIDLDNPVLWQDNTVTGTSAQLYQAVTVATGHILHFKSEFKADGYSLGDLLYSLPLAPGQKKQIVTLDSSYSLSGSEAQEMSQSERIAHSLINTQSIVDQIAGNIGESLSASSSATTKGVSAGLGAGVGGLLAPNVGGGVLLGVAGGYSNASSKASQNSSRNISQFFSEQLRQSTQQNGSSYRKLTSTVVTTVQEGQQYSATAEVVANHNHCHSLTVMYFEVLRHFAIYHKLVDVEECVFVPLLMTKFSLDNVTKWANILALHLLPLHSNTSLKPATFALQKPNHPLIPAFDAAERVRTEWKQVEYPDGRYCDEVIEWVEGELSIVAGIPRPTTKYDNIISLPVTSKFRVSDPFQGFKDFVLGTLSPLIGGGSLEDSKAAEMRTKFFDGFMYLDANFTNVSPARCIRIKSFNPLPQVHVDGTTTNVDPIDFFGSDESTSSMDMWLGYSELLGYGPTKEDLRRFLTKHFRMQLIGDWNTIWYQKVAPEVFTKLLGHIRSSISGSFDTTQMGKFTSAGEQTVNVAFTGGASIARKDISTLKLYNDSIAAKKLNLTQLVFRVKALRLSYSTAHYNGILFRGNMNGDLLDDTGATCQTPLSALEKRNPKLDDRFLAQRLITHLNENLEYYNRVIWLSLDENRRYLLLDGFQMETFDRHGNHEGYRSLASVLKNFLVGVVGNSLVFPVAPGYRVNQSLIVAESTDAQNTQPESLLDHYRPSLPPPPYRLSIPTPGVFCESRMGECDSCEKTKPDSSQDWTKFTTNEPTVINPVAPSLSEPPNWQPTTKDFASPMVQIQNNPTMPDPGIGLKALNELFGKSDIFKDVTGLDANQKNALEVYKSNQDNVKSLAQMASSMANQAHNTSNSSKIMDTIKEAYDSGALSDSERKALVKDHLQQQIDGGVTKQSELGTGKRSQAPLITDTVTKAAVDQNRDMTASMTEPDGTTQTVEIKSGTKPETSVIAGANGEIKPIKQSGDTCWAAAVAMMVSWQFQTNLDIETALRQAGEDYVDLFKSGAALNATDTHNLIKKLDMVSEPGGSYYYSRYVQLMTTYGPLWVILDAQPEPGPLATHSVVLVKIEGGKDLADDGTYFTWFDPQTGEAVRRNYTEFRKMFEQALTDADPRSSGVDAIISSQIAHYPYDLRSKIGYKFGSLIYHPVHEYMVLQVLRESKFISSKVITPGSNPSINEFLRGVIWPDDPECLLFRPLTLKNWGKLLGQTLLRRYQDAKEWSQKGDAIEPNDLLGRTHFGDLQQWHSMANENGEDPKLTQARILLWAEVLYKIAVNDGLTASERLKHVSISRVLPGSSPASASVRLEFKELFSKDSRPTSSQTLQDLLAPKEIYYRLDVRRRALGALFHAIQDSFARGHTRRKLLNPEDQISSDVQGGFTPGKWAELGDIEVFHCYAGQDSEKHGNWDMFRATPGMELNDWNALWGARDAIAKCTWVMKAFMAKRKWKEFAPNEPTVEEWFSNKCFKVADDARPSDHEVS